MSLKKQASVTNEAQDGKWFDYCVDKQNGKMIRFKLRYMDPKNREWMTALSKYGRKNRSNQIKAEDIDFDQLEKLDDSVLNAMVDYVVIAWENVLEYRETHLKAAGIEPENFDTCDVQMEFKPGNVKFLLKDLPQVFADLKEVAGNFRNFVAEDTPDTEESEAADEAAVGN